MKKVEFLDKVCNEVVLIIIIYRVHLVGSNPTISQCIIINSPMAKAPDKGSFPLDHFHECDTEAKEYTQCISRHQLVPKRCRPAQMAYLQCRMKSGLMDQQQMTTLGFVKENSWESEEQEKDALWKKIQSQKEDAWMTALKRAQESRKANPQTNLPE